MAKPKMTVVDKPKQVIAPYVPTDLERATLEAHAQRRAETAPRIRLKVKAVAEGKAEILIDHDDGPVGASLIEASFGTTDWPVVEALAGQLAQLANINGAVCNARFQQAMALAQGVQPTDEVEAMLATQMAAIHLATMEYAGRLHRSTSVQVSEAYERSLTRLSRTFAAQVDALKKYRSKGEQRVVVEHKHYHLHQAPDQAGGGVETETEHQSHVRSIPEREAVLGQIEADGTEVSWASGERQERVSVSRRAGGGSERPA
jgi:DNA-binding HxlR family transcriptional regulator